MECKETSDFLFRGLIKKYNIRFSFTETTRAVEDLISTHLSDPLASLILGEALTIGSLISPLLNEGEKYSVKWEYEGLVKSILVDVDSSNNLRGLPAATMLMEKVKTLQDLYGDNGTITIIKFKDGKILSSGTAAAGILNVTSDIDFFFSTSDQLETETSISSKFNPDPYKPVDIFAGLMIQAMPDCDMDKFAKMRDVMATQEFKELLCSKELPIEKKLNSLLAKALGETTIPQNLRDSYQISYQFANSPTFTCSCNKEKMKTAIKTLPEEELEEIYESNSKPKIVCQFCKKEYTFSKEELED